MEERINPEYGKPDKRKEFLYPRLSKGNISGERVFNDIREYVKQVYWDKVSETSESEDRDGLYIGDLTPDFLGNVLAHITENSPHPDIVRPNEWLPRMILEQYMKSRKDQLRKKPPAPSASNSDRSPTRRERSVERPVETSKTHLPPGEDQQAPNASQSSRVFWDPVRGSREPSD